MHLTDINCIMKEIQREITPLNKDDLFILLNNRNAKFDYPIHFHPDFELNLVMNTTGKRVVGDSVEEFGGTDMVLLGPNLPHVWKGGSGPETHVITIQFHEQLLNSFLLSKRLFAPIREMLERSARGIDFSGEVKDRIVPKLIELSRSHGFDTALDFFSVLYDLAISRDQRLLASATYDTSSVMRESKSRRISAICQFIEENYHRDISLKDIASQIGMSESATSHFFRKRTNRSFVSYLSDVRIGHATKMLIETSHSISEICYMCGYTNLSNFNRMFRKVKDQTPSEYRASIQQVLTKF